jgi:hypothetical protein
MFVQRVNPAASVERVHRGNRRVSFSDGEGVALTALHARVYPARFDTFRRCKLSHVSEDTLRPRQHTSTS